MKKMIQVITLFLLSNIGDTQSNQYLLPQLGDDALRTINWSTCDFPRSKEEHTFWLNQLLYTTKTIFEKHHLPYWAVYGTLLGAVRNKTIMSHIMDVDLQTFPEYLLELCNHSSQLYQEFHSRGLKIHDCLVDTSKITPFYTGNHSGIIPYNQSITEGYLAFGRICKANASHQEPLYSLQNVTTKDGLQLQKTYWFDTRLDFYSAKQIDKEIHHTTFSHCFWNFSHLKPLQLYQVNNYQVYGPNDYDYWLQMAYGPDWRTPIRRYIWGKPNSCWWGNLGSPITPSSLTTIRDSL